MTELSDKELNVKLAEAMGRENIRIESDAVYCGESITGAYRVTRDFKYSDPAIFAENVSWLLDNDHDIESKMDDVYLIIDVRGPDAIATKDKDIFKAVALARINAEDK